MPIFTTFMHKTHVQHHISEENKIQASSLANTPLSHPSHLGMAHPQICGKLWQNFFMGDPYPLQVQKGNRMKFDTQLKTHLLSSPHTVHLFHIDKSCDIPVITWQLPSISNFTKIGQKTQCAPNF